MTIDNSLVSDFGAWLRNEHRMSARTANTYAHIAATFLLESGLDPSSLTSLDLQRWFHGQPGEFSTQRTRRAGLVRFFEYLVFRDLRDDNPAIELNLPAAPARSPVEPVEDVEDRLFALRDTDETAFLVALFVIHTRLKMAALDSISERPPVPEFVSVRGRGQVRRRVRLAPVARKLLDELGGSLPVRQRTLQRRFQQVGLSAEQLRHTTPSDAVWRMTPYSPPPLDIPEYVGTSIESYRDEAWVCFIYGNLRGAALVARSALQLCVRRYLPPEEWSGSLAREQELVAARLGPAWAALGSDIRNFGNEWAHPDPRDPAGPPSRDIVKERLDTMDNVLRFTANVERRRHIRPAHP
jgi:hypothetical protein